MKKAGLFLLFSVFLVPQTFANETSVEVNSEGDSSATVNVKNTFNTSSSNSNTVDSHTKVRIETDGEVKEYETFNGEDVNIESNNGNTKVNISNNSKLLNPKITKVQEKINEATTEAQKKVEDAKHEKMNIFELIESIILGLFKNLL